MLTKLVMIAVTVVWLLGVIGIVFIIGGDEE